VRRDVFERELLQGLQSKVLREEVIDYVLDQFEKQLVREIDGISGEMDRMKKRKTELQSEIGTCLSAAILDRTNSGFEESRRSEISEISCSRFVISAITAGEWNPVARPAVSLAKNGSFRIN
jgi:hypothetical protein